MSSSIDERFVFRSILPEETSQAIQIEQTCFPPHEACTPNQISGYIAAMPELFLVAVDRETGLLAGFLVGISTDEESFRDDFFTNLSLYNPFGAQVMILSLNVLPEYRLQGLGRTLIFCYAERERTKGRKKLILTCLDEKVEMYQKFGFIDDGTANSSWGGEIWHQMTMIL